MDAVLSGAITKQQLQPVIWRNPQIIKRSRVRQHPQLAARHRLNLVPTTPNVVTANTGEFQRVGGLVLENWR